MTIIEPEFMALTQNLDLSDFWAENETCYALTPNKPRCAMEFAQDDHWLFEFMKIPSTMRYYHDKTYRDALHKQVNTIMVKAVGIPLYDENTWQHTPKRIEYLFGCEFTYHEGSTPWLTPVTSDPDEFSSILDRAEAVDIKTWAFTDAFLQEWDERQASGLPMPKLGDGSRGPATIMTSILEAETVFYWLFDHPDLMTRFRDILGAKMIELNRALRDFSNNDQAGWFILDDNSALFSPKLYRQYCVPILEQVINEFAPGDTRRYQHSDSAIGHLLDQQATLGITEVNYGPEIDVALIREKLPGALIRGHIPPFLLRNGSPEAIQTRIRQDFIKAGASGRLLVTPAGSLVGGTGIGRMRWMMQVVQDHCRYDS